MRRMYRKRIDQENARVTKAENWIVKGKERVRRDARMAAKLSAGSLPYAPVVMSWLSRKLNKRSGLITQQEVQTLLT